MKTNLRVITVLSMVSVGVTSSAGAEESVNPSRVSSGVVQSIYESRNFRKYPMLGKNYVLPSSKDKSSSLEAVPHCKETEGKPLKMEGAPLIPGTASEIRESKNVEKLFNESMSFNPDIAEAVEKVKLLQNESSTARSKNRFLEIGPNNKQLAECRKSGATKEEFLLHKKVNDHFNRILGLYQRFEKASSSEKKSKYRDSLVKLVGENAMKKME